MDTDVNSFERVPHYILAEEHVQHREGALLTEDPTIAIITPRGDYNG
ncbi:MAG: hypothetical protein HY318_07330 [Armatimonadetes bacterium]|nr:hypothetical protein [Armatimonadota bacterium]